MLTIRFLEKPALTAFSKEFWLAFLKSVLDSFFLYGAAYLLRTFTKSAVKRAGCKHSTPQPRQQAEQRSKHRTQHP